MSLDWVPASISERFRLWVAVQDGKYIQSRCRVEMGPQWRMVDPPLGSEDYPEAISDMDADTTHRVVWEEAEAAGVRGTILVEARPYWLEDIQGDYSGFYWVVLRQVHEPNAAVHARTEIESCVFGDADFEDLQ